jgi:pimeloyl-ACP methyl ester carboxylesterase
MVLPHHATVRANDTVSATSSVLFLHGILGSGANLRALATRYVASRPGVTVTLVDLRGHGKTKAGDDPHSVGACARDLVALETHLSLPVSGVLGHSFGGKVALAYHALRPDLTRVHILDSAPFARAEPTGSEQTMRVIDMLEAAPAQFADREAFSAYVLRHGHSRAVAEWLAMNLERADGEVRFRPSLPQIRALLDDYFALDLWHVLEGSRAETDVVIGGRSYVWEPGHRARLAELSERTRGRVREHSLPEAGHWIHIDDPKGTVEAITAR